MTSSRACRMWVGASHGLPAHPRRIGRRIWLWASVFVVIVGLLTSCKAKNTVAGRAASASTISAPASASLTRPSAGPTTSSAKQKSPTPSDTTGGEVITPAGVVLPDPHRTPGAAYTAVTQATISWTICVTGWTTTIRPPSNYTTTLKEQQLATGYTYRGDTNASDYEEDHLISLELGGSPTSTLNLWPEPYTGADGARVKDQVENKLHSMVCAGSIRLATAQHAIAANWWTAYLTYVGPAPATHTYAPPPPPAATTAPASTLSCRASMSNANPAQYSTIDVIVHTAAGASVAATAHYKSTETTHTGTASSSGAASIAFSISRATIGYTVDVDVTVTRNGASRSCSTSFTPR